MTGELERIWKEDIAALSSIIPGLCLEGLRKTTKTPKMTDVPAEIST
jgi:hypothetical protein